MKKQPKAKDENKITINTFLLAAILEEGAQELHKADAQGLKTVTFEKNVRFRDVMRFLLTSKNRDALDRIDRLQNERQGT